MFSYSFFSSFSIFYSTQAKEQVCWSVDMAGLQVISLELLFYLSGPAQAELNAGAPLN